MAVYAGFVGPSYTLESRVADCEECINLFPVVMETQFAKSQSMLMPTPGLDEFATSPRSPGRGAFSQDGRTFFVVSYTLYELNTATGALTDRGTMEVNDEPATICSSGDVGNELFVTSGGKGYILDLITDVFTEISGLVATMGAYLDGFFLALDANDSILRISEYADGLTWDPLQFRARASAGDKWVAMAVTPHKEIWLMGSQTYEVWYNAGTYPFPFQPIQGAFYREGIAARWSLSLSGEGVAWLSANSDGKGQIMFSQQYAPQRVSNIGVENFINKAIEAGINVNDAVSFTYTQAGFTFYVITFPEANMTWAMDTRTQAWHKRLYWRVGPSGIASYEAWRPMYHCATGDLHLVADRATGQIYRMSTSVYYDANEQLIRRVRRAPHIHNEKKRVQYSYVELDMSVGVGLPNNDDWGVGKDPKIYMRYSNNGGMTWGSMREKSIGEIGKYNTRVRFNQLGQGRDRVFEFIMSDPVPYLINNAYLDFKMGKS